MIVLENVTKKFGQRILFENLNIEIGKGEFVGISGESGVGKSTLLNIIGLMDRAYHGEVYIKGKPTHILKKRSIEALIRESINYLFQNYALVDDKTVRYNLNLLPLTVREDEMTQALECVGLGDDVLDTPVYILSGGEQQRVALARTVIKRGDIVLADEPTGNLDEANARIVIDVLKELASQGMAVVIVSHNQEVLRHCDRVIDL